MKKILVQQLVRIFINACCVAMLLPVTGCKKDINEPQNISSRIMFCNTSPYLSKMLEATTGNARIAEVLIDDAVPGMINTGDAATSISNPYFRGAQTSSGTPPVLYFPYTTGVTDQYWIRYMQVKAQQHRIRLLDTLQNALIDTVLVSSEQKPVSIFFADTATRMSAVALEQDEVVVPGKARLRLLNLIPDAKGGELIVRVATQPSLTEGTAYLAASDWAAYSIPEGGRLYVNVYAKEDTLAPLMQNSVTVKAGHSYLLVAKGYTRSVQIRPPGRPVIIISAAPRLDIINTF